MVWRLDSNGMDIRATRFKRRGRSSKATKEAEKQAKRALEE